MIPLTLHSSLHLCSQSLKLGEKLLPFLVGGEGGRFESKPTIDLNEGLQLQLIEKKTTLVWPTPISNPKGHQYIPEIMLKSGRCQLIERGTPFPALIEHWMMTSLYSGIIVRHTPVVQF